MVSTHLEPTILRFGGAGTRSQVLYLALQTTRQKLLVLSVVHLAKEVKFFLRSSVYIPSECNIQNFRVPGGLAKELIFWGVIDIEYIVDRVSCVHHHPPLTNRLGNSSTPA
jgi:hypothetical protein